MKTWMDLETEESIDNPIPWIIADFEEKSETLKNFMLNLKISASFFKTRCDKARSYL